uniref:WD repeat-containing protein 18-like n=1 Tax=Styela clava TaxID=7725 RepID=UPI001939EECB|nr:WD repeat-containing protein 18-like [Styela clava]
MFEVLMISESSGQSFNIATYNASNGQSISSFKGGTSLPRTLCQIKNEYIISAIPNKPVIQVYEISRKSQQSKKVALPGIISSLTISNDGVLLAAGINNNVLVWELSGGILLSILSSHYQNVTCLSFCHDDSYLATSGDDGIVSVWDVSLIWDKEASGTGSVEPYHSWTSHTMATTQLKFGLRYRVYSSSLDCSVKVYDIPSKQIILSIIFNFGVSYFDFTPNEIFLFVGCSNGSLHRVNLLHHCQTAILQSTDDNERAVIKNAHQKLITSISCGLDGTSIVTGSEDGQVKFWDIASLQCSKTMKFSGKITNLFLTTAITGFSSTLGAQTVVMPFPKLHRQAISTNNETDSDLIHCKLMKSEDYD